MAKDNKSLGKFILNGIPPAPRGVPQIEVSFDVDVNGILQVSATDKGTGKAQSITITNTGGLNAQEIEQMRQEAEVYAQKDLLRLRRVELENQAEALFYTYDSAWEKNREYISEQLGAKLQTAKQRLTTALNNPQVTNEVFQSYLEQFRTLLLEVGKIAYEPQPQITAPQSRAAKPPVEQIAPPKKAEVQVGVERMEEPEVLPEIDTDFSATDFDFVKDTEFDTPEETSGDDFEFSFEVID